LARRLNTRPPRRSHLHSIELHDASVRLGRHWAVRDITLAVEAGQHWLLTGANGSGKTILMKLLRGDVWPTPTGRERRIYRLGHEQHDQPLLVREHIAYLGPEAQDKFERYEWNLPVQDVVATGIADSDLPLERPSRREAKRALNALRGVGLAGLAQRRFLSLSYGQRRRVLLARALVRRPDVLLLDEVLNGLDTRSRKAFLRSLRHATHARTCWVLSTHRPGDHPPGVTHVARLLRGRLVEAGAIGSHGTRKPRRRRGHRSRPGSAQATAPASDPRSDTRATPTLRLRNVSVFRDYRPVLNGLDWELRPHEHWCIAGANGSGKSTLIALLYGDLPAALGGRVERAGLGRGEPIDAWKQRVGLVSPELQATYATTVNTVLEIVVSGLHSSVGLNAPPMHTELRRARRVLRAVGIDALAQRRARELSYGQLRLALFARALVMPRELLLLDEPFDGLDTDARRIVARLVERAVEQGAQVVIATHHRDDVPAFVTRRLDLAQPVATSLR